MQDTVENSILRHAGDAECFTEHYFSILFGNGTCQVTAVVFLLCLQCYWQTEAGYDK